MNVFVLSAGRCGSEIFANACRHITNYTTGFETQNDRSRGNPYTRFGYPSSHIEIDEGLSWLLGDLQQAYGDDAYYVHLQRDPERVAESFAAAWDSPRQNAAAAFALGTLGYSRREVDAMSSERRREVALQYCHVVNANINAFLRDKPQKIGVHLLDIDEDFRRFWTAIGALGELTRGLEEWRVRIDPDRGKTPVASEPPGEAISSTRVAERTRELLDRTMTETPGMDVSWVSRATAPKSWEKRGETLQFLTALIRRHAPRHVIQFGTGIATQVIVRECGDLPVTSRVTAIDHDPDFMRITRFTLNAQSIPTGGLHLLHCPLVARNMEGNPVPAYLLRANEFASQVPADLVLIQGPPDVLGGCEGVLYQALDFARPGTIFLLDGIQRQDQQEVVKRWNINLGRAIEIRPMKEIDPGLAAVIVCEPVRSTELKQHQIKLLSEEIDTCVPRSESVIVVDGKRWEESDNIAGRKRIPFTENRGHYGGPPADDATGVRELEKLRKRGAGFIVFAWPAFNWLDRYPGLHRYLRQSYSCVRESGRVVAFDIRRQVPRASPN